MSDMLRLLERFDAVLFTLAVGSYGYTTLAVGWLLAKIERLTHNHIKHLKDDISALEKRLDALERK